MTTVAGKSVESSRPVGAAGRWMAPMLALASVSTALCWLLFSDLADARAAAAAMPAVVALLAPMFAPLGRSLAGDLIPLGAWCVECAALAVILLAMICPVAVPGTVLAASFGMCLALLLASHAALLGGLHGAPAAWRFEQRREWAAWTVTGTLAVLGAAPVWLAPLAQAFAGGASIADLAVAISPLSHLAATTGSDVLRTDWFYRNSSIASLRYAYPAIGTVLVAYAAIGIVALVAVFSASRRDRGIALP